MKMVGLLFFLVAAIALLSGCLNQGGHPSYTIDIRNGSYQPSLITIPAGTTVTWSNHNGTVETVAANDGSFDSYDLADGYEFRYTFLLPGNFSYYSKNHLLMQGKVVVTPSNEAATAEAVPQPPAGQLNASAPATSIELTAKNIAFNKKVITVPAGKKITVFFDNQDVSIPHNFAVYDTGAAQRIIFQGKIVTGPAKITYTFNAPERPGTYFFRCDVHPTIMKGQFVVVASGSSAGKTDLSGQINTSQQLMTPLTPSAMASMPNAGVEQGSTSLQNVIINLTAKNIAFNTRTITVPAGSNVIVHFDNQDAKTPHNLAIYESDVAQKAIFQGKIITGPAKITYNFVAPDQPGTYFFRCDVHPTIMKGQFVVEPSTRPVVASSAGEAIPGAPQGGSPDSTGMGMQSTGEGQAVLIEIRNYAFDPDSITVPAGTRVIWRNFDPVPHTATSTTGVFDSGVIGKGGEFSYIFKNPGTYGYYCAIHPYMKGNIIVTPSNKPQPAAAEVNPSLVGATQPLSSGTMPAAISTTSPQQPVSVIVDLLAKDMNFDRDKITVLAGSKVYINFYNLDVGVPHNFAVYTGSEAMSTIFQGQIITGPARIVYSFDAPVDTGTYFFRCDVHPKVMTGDFYVVSYDNLPPRQESQAVPSQPQMSMPAMGGSAESKTVPSSRNVTGGSKSVIVDLTAENIAFNRSTITVPAGASVTVNFDNRDSGVPHNFAVYYTQDAKTAIFQGKIIIGPDKITYNFKAPDKPDSYFYRCDVHPTQMRGQFIVQ